MAGLSLSGLTKAYDGATQPALDGLDLEIGDGEFLVLVGPSGCGKSTALRLVAGLEEPSGGRIRLCDRDLRGVAPQRRNVAMVFQGYALYPHLSVADNIGFPLKMQRVPPKAREAKVRAMADRVGLGEKLGRLPEQLSGGERQRVAMARAMVREPAVFLFDEPLSNLDAKLRSELRVELSALVKGLGATAIYVTHDQAEAMTMGDRVAMLDRGHLQQVAPPRELYERPVNRTVASFIGTPRINMLEVPRTGRNPTLAVPASLAEGSLGFRPEHAELVAADDRGALVTGVVVGREPLGAETIVHVHVRAEADADVDVRVRVPGFGGPRVGERVGIVVPTALRLWFDAAGNRVEDAV